MFDHDRIRRCYGLPSGACKRDVLAAVLAHASGTPQIVLLEENMEDVVKACCAALGRALPNSEPTPAERDAILQPAAAADRSVRDTVLATVKSFGRLVRAVADALVTLASR